ncbi:hypothetical protein EGW08_007422 [Elysia chlorotica]|uniref:Uncharacterized protein n=1 Tax=Elysia chlorotica TaxID=188477 RepID=A0A3S0ZWM9_ELYCH|nr:hypothetical protein EGW08_007422 [Elysia chlorotica]
MGGRFRGRGRGHPGGRGSKMASSPDVDSSSKEIRINVVIPSPQHVDSYRQYESGQHGYGEQRPQRYDGPAQDFHAPSRGRDFSEGRRTGPPYPDRGFDGLDHCMDYPRAPRQGSYQDSGRFVERRPPPAFPHDDLPYSAGAGRHYDRDPGFDAGPPGYRQDYPHAGRGGAPHGQGPPRQGGNYGPEMMPDSRRGYPATAPDIRYERPPPYEGHNFGMEGAFQHGGRIGQEEQRGFNRGRGGPGFGRGEGERGGRGFGRGAERGGRGFGRGGERGGRGSGRGEGERGGRGFGRGAERGGRGSGRGSEGGRPYEKGKGYGEKKEYGPGGGQEEVGDKKEKAEKVNELNQQRNPKKKWQRRGKKLEDNVLGEGSSSAETSSSVHSGCDPTRQPSVKAQTGQDSGKKNELCETKSSITIKRNFENPAQLEEMLERHFDKKSNASMKFLEGTIIFSEKESVCIVVVTADSKQQAKRLIKNMCAGIYRELKVPCYFCVSGWKETNNNPSKGPEQTEKSGDQDSNQGKTGPADNQPTSKESVAKGKKKKGKKTEKGKSADETTAVPLQTFQTVSKIAITITRGFENTEQLVAFLQTAAGELGPALGEDPSSVSLLAGLTVCEYLVAEEAGAHKLSQALNQVPGVKATAMPHRVLTEQQTEKPKDIGSVISEASVTINELVEKELANHDTKICQTGRSLLDLQTLLSAEGSRPDEKSAQDVSSLMGRLRELEAEKKEFKHRVEKLRASLDGLELSSATEEDVDGILHGVGVECKRLSAGILKTT